MGSKTITIKEKKWTAWHEDLISLINGNFKSIKMRALCELLPSVAFASAAKNFVSMSRGSLETKTDDSAQISVTIKANNTKIKSVVNMKKWIDKHLSGDLVITITHGSLGSDEVVAYSDFDALVIIKDEVFSDAKRLARVAKRLFQARKFMYEQDPLQHHGWFVLPECALRSWPESYLPMAALKHASHISSSERQTLDISLANNSQLEALQLGRLIASIEQNISTGLGFANMYRFKSLISKILLLPTLYLQAQYGKGVFKRDSFEGASLDFTKAEWVVVEAASSIREKWPMVTPIFPSIFSRRPGIIGSYCRKHMSSKVPKNLLACFDDEERGAFARLVTNENIVNMQKKCDSEV